MKVKKGPWSLPVWRIQTDWEVHHLLMLLQQPPLCCQTRLRFISKYPSPNLISGRTYRIKYVSLAFICCQEASKGQWMTAKLIISFSEWRSVSVTSAWLVHIHVQRSAHPEVTKTHRMNKIPLEPTGIQAHHSLLIQWDFLNRNDWLKELHRSKLLCVWVFFLIFFPLFENAKWKKTRML